MKHFSIADLFQDTRLFDMEQPFLFLYVNKNLPINPAIVQNIEQRTGLRYQNRMSGGEVCFAHLNAELRNEYKQTFTKQDILDYVYHQLNSQKLTKETKDISDIFLSYPRNADEFWER